MLPLDAAQPVHPGVPRVQASSLRLCPRERGLAALGPGALGLQPLHLLPVLLDGVLDPGVHHGLGEDPVLGGIRHGLAEKESTEAGQGPELPAWGKVSQPQAPGHSPCRQGQAPNDSLASPPSMLLPQP